MWWFARFCYYKYFCYFSQSWNIFKLFEKLHIKRINPIIETRNLIPVYQFGFRKKHGTIDQVHRITNIIGKALNKKRVCSIVFLDVTQAFDRVWHKGLTYKLTQYLPKQYSQRLESYITDRYFSESGRSLLRTKRRKSEQKCHKEVY